MVPDPKKAHVRTMSKPVFVYVDGRGNGERVRFVLAGANVDYEEKNLTTKEERLALVESGKLITDQVPLLSIDGLDLVQSWSIVRYIGQTRGLVPANDPAAFAKVSPPSSVFNQEGRHYC